GQRTFGRILATSEWEDIGTALALAIDVDPADLIDQGIDEFSDRLRAFAEDRYLLSVLRGDDVFQRLFDGIERHDGHDRSELLLAIKHHLGRYRANDRRIE